MISTKPAIFAALMIVAAFPCRAEQQERWPGYAAWEKQRFETFSPLVQSMLMRNEATAVHLITDGANLTEQVSEHEIKKMVSPNMKTSYVGGEPKREYPLAILAAVAGLSDAVAAIGKRSHEAVITTDPTGNTALAWAARQGNTDVVRTMLGFGDDPLHRDAEGNTPLNLATRKGHASVVALLIASVPQEKRLKTAVTEQVWTASYNEDTATLRALVDGGAPADYIAPQGGTALIEAVTWSSLERVRLLLDHGATVDRHLYRGQSIFDIAEEKVRDGGKDASEILDLIRSAPFNESGWRKPKDVELMERLKF